jgi:hypothetical protein
MARTDATGRPPLRTTSILLTGIGRDAAETLESETVNIEKKV